MQNYGSVQPYPESGSNVTTVPQSYGTPNYQTGPSYGQSQPSGSGPPGGADDAQLPPNGEY